ncbi:ANTAR domain-containing response regulator [Streptomyces sp. BYX5S]
MSPYPDEHHDPVPPYGPTLWAPPSVPLADCRVVRAQILQQRTLERSHIENAQLSGALHSRVLVEQAKGVLAERWDTSVDEAFQAMRGYARNHHLRLTDLARNIVDASFDTRVITAPGPPV